MLERVMLVQKILTRIQFNQGKGIKYPATLAMQAGKWSAPQPRHP